MSTILVGDFETTVYENQSKTEVWASCFCEIGTEKAVVHNSIDKAFQYLQSLREDITLYYHNLKFDGEFWLAFLENDLHYQHATYEEAGETKRVHKQHLKRKQYVTMISDSGVWYSLTIRVGKHLIQLLDSYKLIPLSVEDMGPAFNTKHRKSAIEYKGKRKAGGTITEEEKSYIINDVLVVKESLEYMFKEGHNKVTIGSCCMSEYKKIIKGSKNFHEKYPYSSFRELCPDLTEIFVPEYISGNFKHADDYVRRSYRGAWCYVADGCNGVVFYDGITVDVNSLYPSVMHSMSGNRYPVGKPHFFSCKFGVPDIDKSKQYAFYRIRIRFVLKDGYLPTIQKKGNFLYKHNEYLKTSDIWDEKTGCYHSEYIDLSGNKQQAKIEMTVTQTDLALIYEHYHIIEIEYLDGCWFDTELGIFDEYLDKYKKIKENSTGGLRTCAKLFQNNLYGKFATGTDSSFKIPYLQDGIIKYHTVLENDKPCGYIPIGSAVTSYAREFTIRAAQLNYHGRGCRGFKYADTDSLHIDLPIAMVKGIEIHPTKYLCWKLESEWKQAIFVRQKTYIELSDTYEIKCAGMPERCKKLFVSSITGDNPVDRNGKPFVLSAVEKQFISTKRTLVDFAIGLEVPGKLLPKRIKGGIILTDTTFKMRA